MQAGTDKVKAFLAALVVDALVLLDVLDNPALRIRKLMEVLAVLEEDADRGDEQTEVAVVPLTEHTTEQTWEEAVDVEEEFPGFIA